MGKQRKTSIWEAVCCNFQSNQKIVKEQITNIRKRREASHDVFKAFGDSNIMKKLSMKTEFQTDLDQIEEEDLQQMLKANDE